MNFIFQGYPSNGWLNNWTLESRESGSESHAQDSGTGFRTSEIGGRFSPNIADPEWHLQIPVPQNVHSTLLFNGYCGYLNLGKKRYGAEMLVPESGVLWGRFSGIPAPVLISEISVEQHSGYQWIECDPQPAMLMVENDHFCLVTSSHLQETAYRLGRSYLDRSFADALQQELSLRKGLTHLQEHLDHHDRLLVTSSENLMRSVRHPEGKIPLRWCQSPKMESPGFLSSELYPLVLAWRILDPEMAEELVLCTLSQQSAMGAIPVRCSTHESSTYLEATKPLIVQAAEKAWEKRRSTDFIDKILPDLRRYLQWMLHHFNPKKKGLHCWQTTGEPVLTGKHALEMATVDLTLLLLREIEALQRLEAAADNPPEQPSFGDDLELLESNMFQFWNEKSLTFSNAYIRGNRTRHKSSASFLPLMWDKLPEDQKASMLTKLQESRTVPSGPRVLSWRRSALSDRSFPILKQQLLIEAYRTADSSGSIYFDFTKLVMDGFIEWHVASSDQEKVELDSLLSAFILDLMECRNSRFKNYGPLATFLHRAKHKTKSDRYDLLIFLVMVLGIFFVRIVYHNLHQPPAFQILETSARTAYGNRDIATAYDSCMQIIHYYPEQSTEAQLWAGNLLLSASKAAEAEQFFRKIRAVEPDSPGPMISLGLALQMQGKFKEADANYEEFVLLFDEIFPELVERVWQLRDLTEEGFRTPPRWASIYSYRIMHEL